MEFFVVLLILIAAGTAIHRSKSKKNAAWLEASRLLGLHYKPGGLFQSQELTGVLDGNQVVVDTFTRHNGNVSSVHTRYRVRYPRSLGLGLKLTKQGFFPGVAKFFGLKDIEVGDDEFDRSVVVKGYSPDSVTAFLTVGRRDRVRRLLASLESSEIDDFQITWSERGVTTDPEKMGKVLRQMSSTAYHLVHDTEAGPPPEPVEAPKPEAGLLQALERVKAVKAVEAPPLEVELPVGIPAEAVTAVATEDAPASIPVVSALPEATPRVEEVLGPLSDPAAFCRELFEGSVSSFDAGTQFEQRHAGKAVSWEGTLKTVDTYSFDLVFGDQPGVKAVLVVATLASGLYSGSPVQAIVRLPRESMDALRARVGKRVRFEGTLKSCDGLMRNIFVSDGRVIL